ncbi:hypothetical protein LTR40_009021 [Exophiala xenobiotica]|nr:hypothetical protein LTR40_009021 [Exophiala xenobiotica]
MSMGASSTDWSFTPSATIVAEVTTVTVLPVPQPSPNHGKGVVESNTTVHAQFTSPAGGWNGTYSNTSSWSAATASAGIASPYGVASTITVTNIVATVTQTAASSITTAPTYGYGPPQSNYAPPKASNNYGIEKRQTCVWISAVIGGQEVGWCNNWDGSTTLTYTSWETTVFPTWVPGIGPVGTPSTTPSSSPPPVTATEQSSMQSASSVAPSTTACGQTGPFEIGFDDLPVFSVANNDTADFPPVFNPYEHFYWGPGWSYVPPPNEPFPPQNGSRLAEFIPPLANNDTGSPDAGLIPPSSFGSGPRASDSTYWFSASSAWVACDNGATDWSQTCDFVATAYQWNNATQSEVVVATQHFSIPPCPNFVDCHLTEINFNYLFYKMTTLSFYANVQGKISIFWLDSLALNWYDNTCQAGLERISSRKI